MPEASAAENTAAASSPSSSTHEIRITVGGKISNWVAFALKFLKDNPNARLILHTLPADLKGKDKAKAANPPLPEQPPTSTTEPQSSTSKSNGIKQCTLAIAKLVSVTEIIKREYLKTVDASLVGLYQYNELGNLEEHDSPSEDVVDPALVRSESIIKALNGTKNIRIQRIPYMRVTLCATEIAEFAAPTHAATAQRPEKRQLTKSAKGRLKKRLKKAAGATTSPGSGDEMDIAVA